MGDGANRPKVGVAVILTKKVNVEHLLHSGAFATDTERLWLLGLRKGSHGASTWALPGGHLEFGESWKKCAKRELEEETGYAIRKKHLTFEGVTNDFFPDEQKHYITIVLSGRHYYTPFSAGLCDPEVREPDKIERWDWFSDDRMSEMADEGLLFIPTRNAWEMMRFRLSSKDLRARDRQ